MNKMFVNKRGQIGNLLPLLPVFLLLVFLMALFIFLTLGISAIKGDESSRPFSFSLSEDLMLQKITLEGKEMWVIEALRDYVNGKVSIEQLKEAVKMTLGEKNNHLILFGESREIIYHITPILRMGYYDGKVVEVSGTTIVTPGVAMGNEINSASDDFSKYDKAGLIRRISFNTNNGPFYVEYYYGGRM